MIISQIQRPFLLNITGAYRTSPTAALRAIAGIMPLDIKLEAEAQLTRLKKNLTMLGWIRAHVGHLGNEKADELAKEAITSTEAAVLTVPLRRSSAKHDLKQRALAKWQRRWDNDINCRSTYEIIKKVGLRNHNWPRQLIQFITGHGPFPSYLFRFGKHPDNYCACGEPGTPFHYATKCRLTLSYHLKCPADQHIEAWLKSITNHRLLRNKIIDLLNFITNQEDLLKSEQPE
ncbi:hypothetical protein AVEN_158349-1 [Araneus ventricosus]|uniref:RNase H type-1 domain-containing protein n=1 Tax=Araneus ventricosus TaxID=182803 RepID=A0A4Y2F9V1_ARAVE|nr:hypothetical protein AVEN_158349-1 [Araneus ventricosus]